MHPTILAPRGQEFGKMAFETPIITREGICQTCFFQMDQENMALAGGDVIILLVLLFYLPLGMVKNFLIFFLIFFFNF